MLCARLLDFRTSSKYVDADNEAAFREAAVAYSALFAPQPEADVTTVRLNAYDFPTSRLFKDGQQS
jgi:hypothetical protein